MTKRLTIYVLTIAFTSFCKPAYAMHISEGFLPLGWALFWYLVALPFFIYGLKRIKQLVDDQPQAKLLLGLVGAFAFILSALKLPSVSGSSSHPTGVGLGAILLGPTVMTVISTIVLLFQALLLAHGGLSTLGANLFSMGIAGPLVSALLVMLGRRLALPTKVTIFLSASLGSLTTYVVTALQLALVFSQGNFLLSLGKFLSIFALTQLPLAVIEGLLTVIVFNVLSQYHYSDLRVLEIFRKDVANEKAQ